MPTTFLFLFNCSGITLSTVKDPTRYLNACDPTSLDSFKLVPSIARQTVCTLYTGLQDLQTKQNRGAYTFVSQLVRVGPLLLTILSYESFRHKTFWTRRGASLYLILAQLLSGAISVPLYFATLCYGENGLTSPAKGKKNANDADPEIGIMSSHEGWTILASVVLGYLAPLAYGVWTHWCNKSITTFLCFPLYIMTINTVLPAILRRFNTSTNVSAKLPLLLASGISSILSFDGHLKLLFSGIPFKRIFWPSHTSIGMTQDLHILLLHDYAFVLFELASYIFLYAYRDAPKRERKRAAKVGILVSILAGPIAGLSVIWAMHLLHNGENGADRGDDTRNIGKNGETTRLLAGSSH